MIHKPAISKSLKSEWLQLVTVKANGSRFCPYRLYHPRLSTCDAFNRHFRLVTLQILAGLSYPSAYTSAEWSEDYPMDHFTSETKSGPGTVAERTVFICLICNKKAARKWNIKQHMRTHQGLRPFRCRICGRRSTRKQDLKRHILLVHTIMDDPSDYIEVVI